MVSIAHVIGVDPGLVHTGVVSMEFDSIAGTVIVDHFAFTGLDAQGVAAWIKSAAGVHPKVYIERYRPRQHLGADVRMVQGEQDLRAQLPGATFLPNMGIKRVVQQQLMEMLKVWHWTTTTHHQDLRSAARIALLGMLKDDVLNNLLAEVVRDHLDGRPWLVQHV